LETELKLAYQALQELLSVPEKKWFRKYLLPDPPVEQKLKSSYLDTEDLLFRNNGAVVRVRDVNGDEYIHTVKVSSGGNDGLHQRFEWNYKTSDDRFDVRLFLDQARSDDDPYEVLRSILEQAADMDLSCVLRTRFDRRTHLCGFGDSILEVSLDYGEIIAGDKKENICEMEIELLEGDVRDLLSFGEIVMLKSNCTPESVSKYGRGVRLLGIGDPT